MSGEFHEVRFPASLSFGSLGGPVRRTEIVTLESGHEARNTPWAEARRRYDAGVAMRSLDDLETLIAFFEARRGQLHGFRWKDWADYKSARPSAPVTALDQQIGVGDGERRAFQLVKRYGAPPHEHLRVITKPVAGTVRVAVAGDELVEGVDWEVDVTIGVITFATAPGDGAEVTAGFEFDVPVRFDTDRISVSVARFRAGEVPSVPVVEIRL
ncbi:MAG: TIGR02217 family protein [Alphaproteobacteria bacterium]|nr:MAG: TIGR02217 family protein [Alphaproteobacteria bacterium]